MKFLIFLGIIIALFFTVAYILFILRDRTGKAGYEQPPSSCSKCKKLPLILAFFTLFSFQIVYADDDSSFPFDKECLTFNKANFKTGGALLDVMTTGDFPQYCVLYSLSKYQVKQKRDGGYFIAGSGPDQQHTDATTVFIKSEKAYQHNQPVGQWAYFVGIERFMMDNGAEKEFYTFQENDS